MSKVLSDEDGDAIWNDPTNPNSDPVEEQIHELLCKVSSFTTDEQQLKDMNDAKAKINRLLIEARIDEWLTWYNYDSVEDFTLWEDSAKGLGGTRAKVYDRIAELTNQLNEEGR